MKNCLSQLMMLSLIVQLLLMISAPRPRGEDFESKTTAFLIMRMLKQYRADETLLQPNQRLYRSIKAGTLDLKQIKLHITILDRIKAYFRNPKWKKQVRNQNLFHQHLDWEHLECKQESIPYPNRIRQTSRQYENSLSQIRNAKTRRNPQWRKRRS